MNTAFTQLPDIISMGDKIFEPHWAVHNHQSGHCELLLVVEGWVRTVFYRRRSFTTAPGGFVLIPAGIRHRDGSTTGDESFHGRLPLAASPRLFPTAP